MSAPAGEAHQIVDGRLHVTLNPSSAPRRSRALAALCEELNDTETVYPGTGLVLHYAIKATHQRCMNFHTAPGVLESAAGFQFHQDSDHAANFIERVSDLLDGEIDTRTGVEAPVADSPKATLLR